MEQPWQDYQNQAPRPQAGHTTQSSSVPRPPQVGAPPLAAPPLARPPQPAITIQTQKSMGSVTMPPPPPPGHTPGGATHGQPDLPQQINGTMSNPPGSLPGMIGVHQARPTPIMPVPQAYPRVDRVVNEAEFGKRLTECLVENEEISVDGTAMRLLEGLIEDFVTEVGSRAAKVALFRKSNTLASKDIGLALSRGFGLSVPGCSSGIIVPTQQSTVLGEYGRTVASVRRTNTAANKGQLRDRGAGK